MRNSKWIINNEGRQCSLCGIFKNWSMFAKSKCGTRGNQSWCRDCSRVKRGSKKQVVYLTNETGRECTQCNRFKSWGEFHKRIDGINNHTHICKKCTKKKTQSEQAQGKIRDRDLKRKYGISLEQYKEMFNKQGGVCAICGEEETNQRIKSKTPHYLSVDHCHSTGKVRGLLCQKCNALIGMANDDKILLYSAIEYINKNG